MVNGRDPSTPNAAFPSSCFTIADRGGSSSSFYTATSGTPLGRSPLAAVERGIIYCAYISARREYLSLLVISRSEEQELGIDWNVWSLVLTFAHAPWKCLSSMLQGRVFEAGWTEAEAEAQVGSQLKINLEHHRSSQIRQYCTSKSFRRACIYDVSHRWAAPNIFGDVFILYQLAATNETRKQTLTSCAVTRVECTADSSLNFPR
jgi:hypothetical protein